MEQDSTFKANSDQANNSQNSYSQVSNSPLDHSQRKVSLISP